MIPPAPLGRVLVLTDRAEAAAVGHDLATVVRAAGSAGAAAVVFREKDLDRDDRLHLGEAVRAALDGTASLLIVASDVDLAHRLGASGVHLAQRDGPVDGSDLMVGRSCHDRNEASAAVDEQVDYMTISPVFATPSKPGHGPPLEPEGAVSLLPEPGPSTRDRPLAYGLGGITADTAGTCRAAGLDGVAVMGSVMRAHDPGAVVADLVAAATPARKVVR